MTANGQARFGDAWTQTEELSDSELMSMLISIATPRDEKQSDPAIFDPLLDPQETTSPIPVNSSYRARFLAGKEQELAAAREAYVEIYHSPSNGHIMALDNCRKFAQFAREKISGEVKVLSDSCRDRWCPMCSGQKFSYAKQSTLDYLQTLKSPKFLTLTLRNNENDLKSQVEFLQERFRSLRQRAYWKKNVRGGMWYLEIKRGSGSGMWHPHLHILLDGNYMEQAKLSKLWELVTFGSPILYIVNVNDQERAAGYVAKYSAKPAKLEGMPLDDRVEVITAMFRKRMCGTFGNAKTFTLTPPKVPLDGNWILIGYHDQVIKDAITNPAAKAVLIAYNNYTSLTEDDYTAYTGNPVHVVPVPYVPKTDPQLWLDFFNTC